MIPELGHFALILALFIALLQTIVPMVGAARGNPAWIAIARPAAQAQGLFVLFAFVLLMHSFVVNDFSVLYVAANSNSKLPVIYRISAVWGAHEGSLLLWALILCGWTVAVSLFSKSLPDRFVARVLAVMGAISVGFLSFMLLTSNPFERLLSIPIDGNDLNPLLQDPGLIIHPPMLYIGYVGFSVAFGFAIAALLDGRLDTAWAKWSRPWTTAAWMFLTLGIALGSWWAYYELGWGGWWFWDPVENASFMPWLVGTALIHSLAATEKRGVFKNWTVLLAISAFSLSLLGTFLVRSGVLTSVHAFASDPTRGIYILVFLAIVIGGSLGLYAWRAPTTMQGGSFKPGSRETFLLINSILLSVAMASVLLGTLYPLLNEALGLGKLSVGAPYFNAVFVPLMTPLALIIGIGPQVRWRSDSLSRVWQQVRFIFLACVVIGSLLVIMMTENEMLQTAFGVSIALWIIVSSLLTLFTRVKSSQNSASGFRKIPFGFVGMCLAHIGFAVTIIGITVTSHHSLELHRRMGVSDYVEFAGYNFVLESIQQQQGPNYEAIEARFEVFKGSTAITSLITQKRTYLARGQTMTEAGIDSGLFRDLYVSLGEPLDNGDWSVRLFFRPFVRWLWLGAIFMALGAFLAIADSRYRHRSAVSKETAEALKAGSGVPA
ncbi:MAG: heme lyase CcmF/NrfE family subunit [Gammaproteobacteria bacterium]|nr:heme lyase CcmF/NrfE family subunit [Gammaproteobacteria bacterium]